MNLWGAVRAYAVWGGAFLLAKYGAEFSFRQLFFAAIAAWVWKLGHAVWEDAYGAPPFRRIQFRFQLSLEKILLDSKIYTQEELGPVIDLITEALPGRGWVYFTWLEPRLYFLNTGEAFSIYPEFSFSLKTFRNGMEISPMQSLPDQLAFRQTEEGYALVLISSEQRHSDERPRLYQAAGTLLFKIPATALWALQGSSGLYKSRQNVHACMAEGSNLRHREFAEVRDGWDYENDYGTFRWWYL